MKTLKLIILAAILGPFVAIAAGLLFWMGRPIQEASRDLIVDDDLLADDPGVDVDSGEDHDGH